MSTLDIAGPSSRCVWTGLRGFVTNLEGEGPAVAVFGTANCMFDAVTLVLVQQIAAAAVQLRLDSLAV